MDELNFAFLRAFNMGMDFKTMIDPKNPHNMIDQIDKTVGHYSNPDALQNILKGNQFWLSRIDEMRNDNTEGEYIKSLFNKICKALYDCGKISKDFLDLINRCDLAEHKCFINNELEECDVYTACFTAVKNEPYMIQEYGPCFINFANQIGQYLCNDNQLFRQCVQYKRVLYGHSIEQLIKDTVLDLYHSSNREQWNRVKSFLDSFLFYWRLLVKDDQWSVERENRLIVYLPRDRTLRSELLSGSGITIIDDGKHISIPIVNNLKRLHVDVKDASTLSNIILDNEAWDLLQTVNYGEELLKIGIWYKRK